MEKEVMKICARMLETTIGDMDTKDADLVVKAVIEILKEHSTNTP